MEVGHQAAVEERGGCGPDARCVTCGLREANNHREAGLHELAARVAQNLLSGSPRTATGQDRMTGSCDLLLGPVSGI